MEQGAQGAQWDGKCACVWYVCGVHMVCGVYMLGGVCGVYMVWWWCVWCVCVYGVWWQQR